MVVRDKAASSCRFPASETPSCRFSRPRFSSALSALSSWSLITVANMHISAQPSTFCMLAVCRLHPHIQAGDPCLQRSNSVVASLQLLVNVRELLGGVARLRCRVQNLLLQLGLLFPIQRIFAIYLQLPVQGIGLRPCNIRLLGWLSLPTSSVLSSSEASPGTSLLACCGKFIACWPLSWRLICGDCTAWNWVVMVPHYLAAYIDFADFMRDSSNRRSLVVPSTWGFGSLNNFLVFLYFNYLSKRRCQQWHPMFCGVIVLFIRSLNLASIFVKLQFIILSGSMLVIWWFCHLNDVVDNVIRFSFLVSFSVLYNRARSG